MALFGEASCRPVRDCGTGPYGEIQITAETVFVDQAYQGGSSDGSQTSPFTTIGAALEAAGGGTHIAVAAGEYVEDLIISKPVILEGRCPQLVSIRGLATDDRAAVVLTAVGAELRGVSVHGPAEGIWVLSRDVVIDQIDVYDCDRMGIFLIDGANLLLRRALVRGNTYAGVFLSGGEVILEHTVIRNTLDPYESNGYGIRAEAGKVTLRDSVIEDNLHYALSFRDSDARVERSIIRGTRPNPQDPMSPGCGIVSLGAERTPQLEVVDSLIADNRGMGIAGEGASVSVERSVIRDTRSPLNDGRFGIGIQHNTPDGSAPATTLRVTDSIAADNSSVGILVKNAEAAIARTVIARTRPEIGTWSCAGLHTQLSQVVLEDSVLLSNEVVGVTALGSTLRIARSAIRETQLTQGDRMFGTGIQIFNEDGVPAEVRVEESLLLSNHTAGVWMQSSTLVIERSQIKSTLPDVDGGYGDGIQVERLKIGDPARLTLIDSLVEGHARAGVLLWDASGEIARTVFRTSTFSVAVEGDAGPDIGGDNVFEDNEVNEVSFGQGLQLSPPPDIPDFL